MTQPGIDPNAMESALRALLKASGLDSESADLAATPRRVTELWRREFLAGYAMDPQEILSSPLLGEPNPDAVVVRGLAFHSLCPHHLLPSQGVAHIAYIPQGKLIGFSRLGDLVACFTQRLTLQERATHQIATALVDHLGAAGAACVLEAKQLCLGIPGDRHAQNEVITSAFVGTLESRADLRRRLLG